MIAALVGAESHHGSYYRHEPPWLLQREMLVAALDVSAREGNIIGAPWLHYESPDSCER